MSASPQTPDYSVSEWQKLRQCRRLRASVKAAVWTGELVARLRICIDEGMSPTATATELGFDYRTVLSKAKALGIAFDARPSMPLPTSVHLGAASNKWPLEALTLMLEMRSRARPASWDEIAIAIGGELSGEACRQKIISLRAQERSGHTNGKMDWKADRKGWPSVPATFEDQDRKFLTALLEHVRREKAAA